MCNNKQILSGVVVYNPDIQRLQENISSIYPQVEKLVVVNNGSSNFEEVKKVLPIDVVIIDNAKNLGIASALNQILQYALDNDYTWAITLDQDSVVSLNLVETYKLILRGKDNVAMIHCNIIDRNANMKREQSLPKNDGYIDKCITSASMLRVKAWQQVGGFDDFMFIDSVDFDMCKALSNAGWKIYRTFKTDVLHEVGHSRIIHILHKEFLSYNYTSFRYFYIARNGIYMGRKYGGITKELRIIIRFFYTILFYENNKIEKIFSMIKGVWMGIICNITSAKPRLKKIRLMY